MFIFFQYACQPFQVSSFYLQILNQPLRQLAYAVPPFLGVRSSKQINRNKQEKS